MNTNTILRSDTGTTLGVKPDHFVLTDGATAEIAERLAALTPADAAKVSVFIDHQTPCGSEKHADKQRALINFAVRHDCKLYNGYGTSYQLMLEHEVNPGELVAHCGDFGSTYGAADCYAVKLTPEEMLTALVSGEVSVKVPEQLHLCLTGNLRGGDAKDAALCALLLLGDTHGKLVLVSGEGLEGLSIDERISFFHLLSLGGCEAALSEEKAEKADAVLDLSTVVPAVRTPDGKIVAADTLDQVEPTSVFIGGCSAGRLQDLRAAAAVIRGRHVSRKCRVTVAFASSSVYIQAANEGLIAAFLDAGAVVMNQGCSGCYARSQALVDGKDIVLSAGSRVCPNCNGEGEVPTYLCSAATAMESAIEGKICPAGK